MRQRRFSNTKTHAKGKIWALSDDHPAIVEGRPLFPVTVAPSMSPRLFVSGFNSRKLGGKVIKGEWAGLPIYQLTLPERSTCPKRCHAWKSCYGNAMPFARRHTPGPELEEYIPHELMELSGRHPAGFVIRLHVLGDFYSVDYMKMWFRMMIEHPNLHIFGYTARTEEHDRDIFCRIAVLNAVWPKRCSIRYSRAEPGPMHAIILKDQKVTQNVIVCPAQTEKSECCATCALCWSPAAKHKTIAFIEHGPTSTRVKRLL